jgi:hypothetical protein
VVIFKEMEMILSLNKIVWIPKKSGGKRRIIVVHKDNKQTYLYYLGTLNRIQTECCPYAHGFMPHRSTITSAMEHVGYRYTLSCDLVDFFSNCTTWPSEIDKELGLHIKENCLWHGVPEQGLPTSPAFANLSVAHMDIELDLWLTRLDPDASYTRYADDMMFSSNDRYTMDTMRQVITTTVTKHGHTCHPKKWSLQDAHYGNRVLCGVSIGPDGIQATRRTRRKLRAAGHVLDRRGPRKGRLKRYIGLKGWCDMHLPATERIRQRMRTKSFAEARHIKALMRDKKMPVDDLVGGRHD